MEQQKTWRKLVLDREHFASINDIPLQIGDAVGFPPHWPKDLNIFIKRHRTDELPIPYKPFLAFTPKAFDNSAEVTPWETDTNRFPTLKGLDKRSKPKKSIPDVPLVIIYFVSPQEFAELVLKRMLPMVSFLSSNVSADLLDVRLTN